MNGRKSVLALLALLVALFTSGPLVAQSASANRAHNEPYFLEIAKLDAATYASSKELQGLNQEFESLGIQVTGVYIGKETSFLSIRFPEDDQANRERLIKLMQTSPAVRQIVDGRAAPMVIYDMGKYYRLSKLSDASTLRIEKQPKAKRVRPSILANTGEVIIGYKKDLLNGIDFSATARTSVEAIRKNASGARRRANIIGICEDSIQFDTPVDVETICDQISDLDGIEFVQPNYIYPAQSNPSDPYISPMQTQIFAPQAWGVRTSTNNDIIAIIDSGTSTTHPDLAANLWVNSNRQYYTFTSVDGSISYGQKMEDINGIDTEDASPTNTGVWDGTSYYGNVEASYGPQYHGTHVAAIVGAVGNNSIGSTGTIWTTRMMILKAFKPTNPAYTGALTADSRSIYWAMKYINDRIRTNGDRIKVACLALDTSIVPVTDFLFSSAMSLATDNDILVVGAAGNAGTNLDTSGTPSQFGQINTLVASAVGTTTYHGTTDVQFGNYGKYSTDVLAPGSCALSATDVGPYYTSNYDRPIYAGTSFSAAYVTGLAGLARAQFPSEKANEIADRIRFSSDLIPALSGTTLSDGRINMQKALGERPVICNLSARAFVGTGENNMILGLTINGTTSIRVALIGAGPSLIGQPFNIGGAMPNPRISVYTSIGTLIASNDDYTTLSTADKSIVTSRGFTLNPLDSGIVLTLNPGTYTIAMDPSANTSTGIGLCQIFDVDQPRSSRLSWLSTRLYVGTGTNAPIIGYTINGAAGLHRGAFVAAASGILHYKQFGGAIAVDPSVSVYSGSTLVATNDNWLGAGSALATRLANSGVAIKGWFNPPVDTTKDACTYLSLPTANSGGYISYTVVVTAASPGISMIEMDEY